MTVALVAAALALFLTSAYLTTRAVAHATPRDRGGRALWMGAWAPRDVFVPEGLPFRRWARVTAGLGAICLCLWILVR